MGEHDENVSLRHPGAVGDGIHTFRVIDGIKRMDFPSENDVFTLLPQPLDALIKRSLLGSDEINNVY